MSLLWRLTKWFFYLILLAASGAFAVFFAAYLYVGPRLPDVATLKDIPLQAPMRVLSEDGQLIAEFGEQKRTPVDIKDVPEPMIQALIATEDQRFFSHSGVDIAGLVRVTLNLIATGKRSQGASTITMQLARNYFLTRERTFRRKIFEIFLAWRIEDAFTKHEILSLYLNKISFGHRAHGIGAAARVYYGKQIDELTIPQMAMLVGIPKGPSTHNPISNPPKARKRRDHVLKRMFTVGYLDSESYELYRDTPLTARYHGAKTELRAPYFAEMVRQFVIKEYGRDIAYGAGLNVITTIDPFMQNSAKSALVKGLMDYDRRHGYRGPVRRLVNSGPALEGVLAEAQVEAFIDGDDKKVGSLTPALVTRVLENSAQILLRDKRLQEIDWSGLSWARPYIDDESQGLPPKTADEIVSVGDVIYVNQQQNGLWHLAQKPAVSGAIVSLDPKNGALRALVGGYDFFDSKFNRALQAERQIGSNIKPFVYAAALESGYTPATIVNDAPLTIVDPYQNTVWQPQNSSGRYLGPTRLREALVRSANLVSVRLTEDLGLNYVIDYLARFGFDKQRLPKVKSLALGAATMSPLEVASAYAVFANGGVRVEPFWINRIESSTGDIIWAKNPSEHIATDDDQQSIIRSDFKTVVNPIKKSTVFLINDMLKDVIKRGTGRRAKVLGRQDIAGKTGTTNDAKDAWFTGYHPNLSTSVWVGFDAHHKNLGKAQGAAEWGGKTALPIWVDFMREALKVLPEEEAIEPPGMIRMRIDRTTGQQAATGAPNTIFEWFDEDHLPEPAAEELADPFANEGASDWQDQGIF